MNETIKHTVRLKNFDFPNGEIPFSVLEKIADQLRKVSEGALRIYLEGYSSNKRGREPEWLAKSLDFTLSGIKKGSTVLEIKAPLLTDILVNYQKPLFDELEVDTLKNQTAISLAISAYERAFETNSDTSNFDKNLLKVMLGFNKFFHKEGKEFIDIQSPTINKKIKIAAKNLKKIEILEEKTPADQKIKITGKLEMMRHSNNQLELITTNGKIKAFINNDSLVATAKDFFGDDVTLDGIAHFNPRGKVVSFEIESISTADKSATYFQNTPMAIQATLDLPGLMQIQNYKGVNKNKLNQIIDELDIQEDLSSLLSSLTQ